jgi:hypothetical protein
MLLDIARRYKYKAHGHGVRIKEKQKERRRRSEQKKEADRRAVSPETKRQHGTVALCYSDSD